MSFTQQAQIIKMNLYFFKNKKKILVIGVLLLFAGSMLSYIKQTIEPEETIGGFLCGIGTAIIILSLNLKKTKN
jgi:hypothetical protein